MKVSIINAKGTAIKLNKFVTNLPKTTRTGRLKLATTIRDRAIQNIARFAGKNYPGGSSSRRGSKGLQNITNWSITEVGNQVNIVPAATDDYGRAYAGFVELGTRGHWIENNPYWNKGRQHPGARPNPFVRPAVEQVRQEVSPRVIGWIKQAKKESGLK